ncbi:NACHT, LRR and PYD domains-containing protein 3-like [Chanos chanos]|uniref:NACHT, LRR and PYD domains-containing protein 3-like n=1 Tax=Chanos chanos TaxID=29144 RepID=A0A6J2VDJ6_CHACN|nr:NACHT, LRR and PYD domains-containing protein 3-like [Chanos chanos]
MEQRKQEQSVGCHSAEGLSVSVSAQTGGHSTAIILHNNVFHDKVTFTTTVSGSSNPADIHSQNPGKALQNLKDDYKEWICSQYAYVTEYNSLPGENVLLTDRYSELLIIQRHREQSERETEIRSRGEQFFSARDSEKYSSITVDQFFSPDDRRLTPKAVVLQGNSGNGKSFTAQKIMLDWASGTLYTDHFDFIFHLKCKEMNQISGEKSLVELLRYSQSLTPAQISQILQHSPERVLFLIDGFDELKLSQDNMSTPSLPTDVQTPASPESTLKAVLSGCLLPKSFLLVTTRSTATDTLNKLLKKQPQRFTDIMGFSERGVKEYFQRFFKDDQLLQTQAYELVKANETLFTACFIPVICWIICTVFREKYEVYKNSINYLDTSASIYVDFVSTLLEHHCQGLSQSVPSLLRSLGQLAERGMVEQQVLFDEKSVSETVSDPTSNPFLCKFLLKRRIRQETMFNFVHLSFQEFFTALYYALLNEEESQRVVREILQPLEKSWGTQESKNKQHLLPVIQFLCGLSNKNVSVSLRHNLSVSHCIQAQLKGWILQAMKKSNGRVSSESVMFIFHCLYELHEEEVLRKAMEGWEAVTFSSIILRRTDYWVLQYCLQFCPRIRKLHHMGILSCYSLTPETLKILQPAVCRSEVLWLLVEKLSDDDVGLLVSALGEGKVLHKLRLMKSTLSDQGVQQVLSSLSKQKSVDEVSLTVKTITTKTAVMFLDWIQKINIRVGISVSDNKDNTESVCSALRVLTLGEGPFPVEIMWMYGLSKTQTEPSLLGIRLRCPRSEISNIDWTTFTQILYRLKISRKNSPECDEWYDALLSLLSFLHSVPGLTDVDLRVFRLSENWAARFLSLIHTCPSLEDISVQVKEDCFQAFYQCLSVSVADGNFRFTFKDERLVDGFPKPLPHICFFGPESERSNINWTRLTEIIYRIKDSRQNSPELDEQFDALLSFLNSVPGLKKVELIVISLTESWAARILSLIQTCPSLQDIGVCAGEDGEGLLLEEGIRSLQHSQIRPDCTLTVHGFVSEEMH